MNRKKRGAGKALYAAMAVIAVLIVLAAGVLFGLRRGTIRRESRRDAEAASSSAREMLSTETSVSYAEGVVSLPSSEEKTEDAAPDAGTESALSAASSAGTEPALIDENEAERTEQMLAEQSREARKEDADKLKGVIRAAVPHVGTYAAESGNTGAQAHGGDAKVKKIVMIDPGHQDHAMTDTEPVGPGSGEMKQKLTSGTDGAASGKHEYEVNLEIGLKLRDLLLKRGYEVLMTRETNDINLSNMERALMANSAGADIFLRLHCNSSTDPSQRGVLCYKAGPQNPFVGEELIKSGEKLAALLLESQTAATGQNALGLLDGDDMTGINWAAMPAVIVEMGYMSNPDEDMFLAGETGQLLIAGGLANGVDAFFAGGDGREAS